ncbi:hypothetical protein [Haloferula sp.]|uniref:hypothetical protein n=1 Tax=Haloferula sp. TaxID=2497595 RepID=UPI003C76808C
MAFHPTPPQLFDDFEEGRINRAQLHAALQWHAQELVEEIIEAHENPVAAWWDNMLAKRAADRWSSRHGIWRIRHILAALSKVPEFEPANLLWNALHPDVPLHCFFRMRREPVFRLLKVENRNGILRVRVAHGSTSDGISKEDFVLEHVGNTLEAHRVPLSKKS